MPGVLDRQGANAELQLVDERIVGRKPSTLDHAEAASLPLTALTAWEMLFDRLELRPGGGAGETLLVIGGAGGVPSMAMQLARQLTGSGLVATASRPRASAWVRALRRAPCGRPCPAARRAGGGVGARPPVASSSRPHTDTASWAEMARLMAPQGRIGLIDDRSRSICG